MKIFGKWGSLNSFPKKNSIVLTEDSIAVLKVTSDGIWQVLSVWQNHVLEEELEKGKAGDEFAF